MSSAAQICSLRWERTSGWPSWKWRTSEIWQFTRLMSSNYAAGKLGSYFPLDNILLMDCSWLFSPQQIFYCDLVWDHRSCGRRSWVALQRRGDLTYFKFCSCFHQLTLWKIFIALERSGMKWECLFDVLFPPLVDFTVFSEKEERNLQLNPQYTFKVRW